jgi:diguanylate cyclase (GGDEF)-like protein
MRALPRPTGGLGSRVAMRTFLLFCLCSVAPVILFAALGYGYVRTELHERAQSRLDAASKRYGVLIYERLRETEAFLSERAHTYLLGTQPLAPELLHGERARVVSIQDEPHHARPAQKLEIVEVEGAPVIRVRVTENAGGRAVTLVGEPLPAYLWNDDAMDLREVRYCVNAGRVRLHCTSTEASIPSQDALLVGEWNLFLRAGFRADDWLIRTEQPKDAAVPALSAFRGTLLVSAGLAIAFALLLSSIQIRRSHKPLATLAAAARRMSRGHFDAPVRITGHDEYAGLGRVFNRMAGSLRRQFQLLSAFARVDRLMLERPSIEPVIESVLPKMRKLLRCEIAAVVLREPGTDAARVYAVRSTSNGSLEITRVSIRDAELRSMIGDSARWVANATIADSELHFLRGHAVETWNVAGIHMGSELRGALVLGFRTRPTRNGRIGRHASSLARRLAVALGNEDRERALLQQAYYDPLTGLPNRQLFRDRLEQEVARARHTGGSVALLFIDLDRFKNVNDSLGHGAGDELLKVVARRLAAIAGDARTLARLGGDEFTVIAPVASAHAAGALAAQMLDSVKAPITMQDMQCVVQASIGVAVFPQDGDSAETLVRNADTAMYRAKSAGRGVVVFFEERMNAQAVRRMRLEQRLRVALEQGGLEQHYQLKVHANDGSLAGYEALARWNDPELGLISPAEFIAAAEECGLVAKLDRWSLRAACRTVRRWLDMNLEVGHVAVNVSLRHLRDDTFFEFVEACLREYQLPAHTIELEITESTLADQPEEVSRVLQRIRALGVRIAIDDFGTGYSSMAVLQKMPIDILKIDRAFVIHCAEDDNAAALLEAMINVARGLRKEVVAEGVETPAQAAMLRALGCHFLQGFLFARPATAAQVEDARTRAAARLTA